MQAPWRHDAQQEQNVKAYAVDNEDVIALIRAATDDIDEAGLVLWQEESGYKVANIVPHNVGELGIAKYNAILRDFVERIASPAAIAGGFEVQLSAPQQSIEDWVDPEAATLLRRFSSLANMSTGAAHPRDKQRWFEFLIAAHRLSVGLDTDRLARWLAEVEGWPVETARELAIEYEFAQSLLAQYDQTRT
ncbi:MAG: hypothetical protein RJA98_3012 [Pseudomonadota bacterium]